MNKAAWIIAGVGVIAILTAAAIGWHLWPRQEAAADQQQPALPVTVAAVSGGTAAELFRGIGTIAAQDSVTLSAEAAGRIVKIPVSDGVRVSKGALLLELETRDEAAALEAAEAELATARASYERDQKLVKQGHVAEERLEQSRAAYEMAVAHRKAAKIALENRRITAPFAGRVSLIPLSPGDYVRPGDPLFSIVTDTKLEVDIAIPASLARRTAPDAAVTLRPRAGEALETKIASRDTAADTATNLIVLKAAIPDGKHSLEPGQSVPVTVVVQEREALFVPEEAILLAGPEHYVYRVNGEDIAERTPIETGIRRDGRVEVLSGLAEGDRVVTQGLQKASDGARVNPSPADGEEAKSP